MKTIYALAAVALLCACAPKETDTAGAGASTTATASGDANGKAAMVSDAIIANPAAADSILKANGYTQESFQAEMFAISADSTRSASYAAARTR